MDYRIWTRHELKSNAKVFLSKSYIAAFIVCVIIYVLGVRSDLNMFSNQVNNNTHNVVQQTNVTDVGTGVFFNFFGNSISTALPGIFAIGAFVLFIFTIIFYFFITLPMEVGAKKYFASVDNNYKNIVGYLLHTYTSGKFANVVKIMFSRTLFTFFWSLLLVIPGIIKSYEYKMIPFILGDNPDMDSRRAFDLSRNMTAGYKFQMFLLDLSFIGWFILGGLFMGIGVAFVWPYKYATDGQLYIKLRGIAITNNYTNYEELNMQVVSI